MTGVQLRLLDQLGLPAFHGPMVAADFYLEDGVHLDSFQSALAGRPYSAGRRQKVCARLKPGSRAAHSTADASASWSRCSARSWEPATEGKLLFLEDVGAKPYQIDRMLWQLRQAGKLTACAALFSARCSTALRPARLRICWKTRSLSALDGLDIPIAIGLRSGHVSRQNVTLIFGVEAELTRWR